MKIRADRKTLANALKTVTVPAANGHLAILGGVHIEAAKAAATLTSTNLDLTIAVDIEVDVDKPGIVIVPTRLLSGIVDKAAGDIVSIEATDDSATIESGSTVATLRTLRVEDWPKTPNAEGERFELGANDLDRINRTLHAVAQGDAVKNRPGLGGVHFVGNQAVGVDPHRLAVAQLGVDGLPGMTVPLEVMRRVLKASPEGVTMTFDERSVTFDGGGICWTSRLVVGEFVNWEPLIRKESAHELTVPRAAIVDALDRVSLFAEGDLTHPVDLHREGNTLRLSAASVDVGDICDEIECGGDWTEPLRFHDRFLADLLAAVDGDEVKFEIEDALKPIVARSADWRVLLLVMPVRIGVTK
jgi:DNA polymerase-3 subunit beta